MAWDIPPVNIVIIIEIPTPIIAPKYGIKFDIPIKNPSNTAYFTPKISIATEVSIPTIIASITWLDRNLKNIVFVLLKYFPIAL